MINICIGIEAQNLPTAISNIDLNLNALAIALNGGLGLMNRTMGEILLEGAGRVGLYPSLLT